MSFVTTANSGAVPEKQLKARSSAKALKELLYGESKILDLTMNQHEVTENIVTVS